MDRQYNAGLYLRLSVEDGQNPKKRGGNPFRSESVSIENQREILTKYIRLRGWNVAKEYADDGYTGGNFQRPAFQEMVKDAEAGLIDLILVKDLSRLGRDHIEVDHYVEDVFPSLGVRFIALMDNIDSEGGADILPFRSLLNNYYLKDLSQKIKSVIQAKARAGDYIGNFAPYGYAKDPANRKSGAVQVRNYTCRLHRRTGRSQCSWHTITEPALLAIIREDMQTQLERASVDENRIVGDIQRSLSGIALEDAKKALQLISAKLSGLDAHIQKLYEDRLDGTINLETFMAFSETADAERTETQTEHGRLSKALQTAERQVLDTSRWLDGVRSCLAMDEPDYGILHELIARIEVGEAEGTGGNRRQAVKITYRYVGHIE